MRIHLWVVVFPLLLLIFVLCLWSLLIWVVSVLGVSCLGLSRLLGLGWLFASPFGGSFQLLSHQVFSHGLSFLSSGIPVIRMLGCVNIVPEVSQVVLISFNSFFFFLSAFLFLPFCLLPHLSYLLPLLFYCWFPEECFWCHFLHYSLYVGSFYFF